MNFSMCNLIKTWSWRITCVERWTLSWMLEVVDPDSLVGIFDNLFTNLPLNPQRFLPLLLGGRGRVRAIKFHVSAEIRITTQTLD